MFVVVITLLPDHICLSLPFLHLELIMNPNDLYGCVNLSHFPHRFLGIIKLHENSLRHSRFPLGKLLRRLRLTPTWFLGCISSRRYFPQLPKLSVFQALPTGLRLGREPNAFIVMVNKKVIVTFLQVPWPFLSHRNLLFLKNFPYESIIYLLYLPIIFYFMLMFTFWCLSYWHWFVTCATKVLLTNLLSCKVAFLAVFPSVNSCLN